MGGEHPFVGLTHFDPPSFLLMCLGKLLFHILIHTVLIHNISSYIVSSLYLTFKSAQRSAPLRLGCPWNGWVVLEAKAHCHPHVLSWALANGCPQPTEVGRVFIAGT